ncbi:MAG: hypothetical protein FWC70_13180 [Defluviitaleaceae bacterium]|nr:hypothetical protein [Defluviitaleaceae bacterium]
MPATGMVIRAMKYGITGIKYGILLMTALTLLYKTAVEVRAEQPDRIAVAASTPRIICHNCGSWLCDMMCLPPCPHCWVFGCLGFCIMLPCPHCWVSGCGGQCQHPPPPPDLLDFLASEFHQLSTQMNEIADAQHETKFDAMNFLMSSQLWTVGLTAYISGLGLIAVIALCIKK